MVNITVDIILPVYRGNITQLELGVDQLVKYFRENLKDYSWKVVISVNGSGANEVLNLSKKLSKKYKEVVYIYTENGGKGNGVFNGWQYSKADIMTYMDLDLATNLDSFRPLVKAVEEGYDIAVGSRYHPQSIALRTILRLILSKVYLLLFFKWILGVKCDDAQCGFKAVNKKVVDDIIPLVKDRDFFFDSELLYYAYKKGLKIKEIPIRWREAEFSSVNTVKIVPKFIKNVIRLKFSKIQK